MRDWLWPQVLPALGLTENRGTEFICLMTTAVLKTWSPAQRELPQILLYERQAWVWGGSLLT